MAVAMNVVRSELPKDVDIVAFQCRNPIHRAHYEASGIVETDIMWLVMIEIAG